MNKLWLLLLDTNHSATVLVVYNYRTSLYNKYICLVSFCPLLKYKKTRSPYYSKYCATKFPALMIVVHTFYSRVLFVYAHISKDISHSGITLWTKISYFSFFCILDVVKKPIFIRLCMHRFCYDCFQKSITIQKVR